MYSMAEITERLLTNFYVNKISTVRHEDGRECNFIGLINGKKIGLDYDKESNLINATVWESWEQKEEQEEDLHKQHLNYSINKHSLDDFIKIHAQGLFSIKYEKSDSGENMYAKVYNVDNYPIYEFDWEKEEEDDDSLEKYIHAARSHGFLLVNFCSDRVEAFLV